MIDQINVLVDISHWNRDVDFAKLANAGIIGVIQKATQGQTGVDFTYNTNKPKALAAGLLWGAYHFGDGSDGVAQAEHFLSTVNDQSKTLLALDFESNPTGPSMDVVEAAAFVTHVQQQTGRFTGFYSGNDIKQQLGREGSRAGTMLVLVGPIRAYTCSPRELAYMDDVAIHRWQFRPTSPRRCGRAV